MNEKPLRILLGDNRIVTMDEFFAGGERSHRQQAGLPFEEKIRILITLQKLAFGWGGRKDVLVWGHGS